MGDTVSARASVRVREIVGFLFLTVIIAPLVSILLVGGYGFLIWMVQLVAGPPSI